MVSQDTPRDSIPTEWILSRRGFLAAGSVVSLLPIGGATTGTGRNVRYAMENGDESTGKNSRPAHSRVARVAVDDRAMGNAQTNTVPFSPRLVTYNGRQYFAYWTHDGLLTVVARLLPDGDWQRNQTDIEIARRDGHYPPALGIGPSGHVFLAYNVRGTTPRWRRSRHPEDITAFGDEQVGMTGENESGANYPEFTQLRDGTLLFGYRQGGSGSGKWMLNQWDEPTESWEPLQHPLTSGESGITATGVDQRNSYHWNLIQSEDGVLHYFFCWREGPLAQTNYRLSYARSPDNGNTWTRSGGTPYSLPITMDEAEVVDNILPNSDLINQGWASFDPRTGAPHVAYYRDDDDGNTQIYHAYLDGSEWRVEPATARDSSVDLGGLGTLASTIGRMGIVVGDTGNVHILTRDFENGGWPLLLEKVDGVWHATPVFRRNLVHADIHIDPERWRSDRILSFIDQPQAIRNAAWNDAPTLLTITDVDIGDGSLHEQRQRNGPPPWVPSESQADHGHNVQHPTTNENT